MKRTLILIVLIIIFDMPHLCGQSFTDTIAMQQRKIEELNKKIQNLDKKINQTNNNLDLLSQRNIYEIDRINNTILTEKNSLNQDVGKINEALDRKTDKKTVADYQKTIKKNNNLIIVGFIILIFCIVSIFLLIRKNKCSLSHQIELFQRKTLDLDKRFLALIEEKLKVEQSIDHSFVLKVADEIIRIQRNLNAMGVEIKGVKQISGALTRIQEILKSNRYEIVEMLNKPYNEGMRAEANFVTDENLQVGEQIISRIIKPQVNYNGILVQPAQIEVRKGL